MHQKSSKYGALCNSNMFFPRNVYQVRESLCNKPESSSIPYNDDQNSFRTLVNFDSKSVFEQENISCVTDSTTWIGYQAPISFLFWSNFMEEPLFPSHPNQWDLLESFFGAPDGLTTQSKGQSKLIFKDTETNVKNNLNQISCIVEKRPSWKELLTEIENECIEK